MLDQFADQTGGSEFNNVFRVNDLAPRTLPLAVPATSQVIFIDTEQLEFIMENFWEFGREVLFIFADSYQLPCCSAAKF